MALDMSDELDPRIASRRSNQLIFATVLAFGFAGAIAMTLVGSRMATSLAIVMCYGLIAVALVAREVEKWTLRGLISPLSIYAVFWFAYNAVPLPLAVASSGTPGGAKAEPAWLNVAGLVSLGSLLLVAIGYSIGSRQFVGRRVAFPPLTLQLAVLMAAVGWSTRLYLVAAGDFGYLGLSSEWSAGPVQTLMTLGSSFAPLSTAALGYLSWSREAPNQGARSLLPFMVLATAIVGLVGGFKAQVFTDLVPLIVVYIYLRRRVPLTPLVLIFLFIVLSRTGVQDYRSDLTSGKLQGDAGVSTTTEAVLGRVVEGSRAHGFGEQFGGFFEHLAGYEQVPDNLALILSRTGQDLPFLGIKRALLEPIPIVPIAVANDNGSFSVTRYVYQAYRGNIEISSSPAGQPGDLYMSAGWPAVIVGELLVGLLLGLLWGFVWRRNDPTVTVLYAVLSVVLANYGKEFGLLIRSLAQQAFGLWIAVGLLAFISSNLMGGKISETLDSRTKGGGPVP